MVPNHYFICVYFSFFSNTFIQYVLELLPKIETGRGAGDYLYDSTRNEIIILPVVAQIIMCEYQICFVLSVD